jgi:hypothetical protein
MGTATDQVLFCPFCREAFEGDQRCPEHELDLVTWAELPRASVPQLTDDYALPWPSGQLGRGWVAGGAALVLLAFIGLPLAGVEGPLRMGGSMLMLAVASTPKLWLVPAAAWAELAILYRRRTPASMRGARVAVALVAFVPLLAAAMTWFDVSAAIELVEQRRHVELQLRPAAGAYVLAAAALTMLWGAIRLGTPR